MQVTCSFRIYPTLEQETKFNSWLVLCHKLYNFAMPKIGHVRIRLHRDFDFRTAGTINIKLRGNDWYANITCEIPIAVSSTEPSKSIGIDVGLYIFVATSKGDLIDNPRGVFTSTL